MRFATLFSLLISGVVPLCAGCGSGSHSGSSSPSTGAGAASTAPSASQQSPAAPTTPAPGAPASPAAGGGFSSSAPLVTPRYGHSAVLLADGRVLVTGGIDASAITAAAEVYDPQADRWSPLPDMTTVRVWHDSIRLPGGRVLIVGGEWPATPSAEIFDPLTDTFAAAPGARLPRNSTGLALLPNGRVLTTSTNTHGANQSGLIRDDGRTEIFDPATNAWSPGPTQTSGTQLKEAYVEIGGAVFSTENTGGVQVLSGGQWTPLLTNQTNARPTEHRFSERTPAALPAGRLILLGGFYAEVTRETQVFSSATGTWSAGPLLNTARIFTEAVTLEDGSGDLLVVGGQNALGAAPAATNTAEIYDAAADTFRATANMARARLYHEVIALPDGRVLVVGGSSSPTRLEALAECEVFTR
jgi:hypothetical protein